MRIINKLGFIVDHLQMNDFMWWTFDIFSLIDILFLYWNNLFLFILMNLLMVMIFRAY